MKDKIKFIKEIASNMNENKIDKLKYEDSNFEIELNKKHKKIPISMFNYSQMNGYNSNFASQQEIHTKTEDVKEEVNDVVITETVVNGINIESPMVGTFYSSPSPDSPPFIKEGDKVVEGQTLCIVEAMKLMNEVKSTVSGKVIKIMAKNGEIIKKGQILVVIE